MARWLWYLTPSAVDQWLKLTGRGTVDTATDADYAAAEDELGQLSLTARLSESASAKTESGGQVYRGKVTVRGKRVRVEAVVMPGQRSEGPLPQLVRVTLK